MKVNSTAWPKVVLITKRLSKFLKMHQDLAKGIWKTAQVMQD